MPRVERHDAMERLLSWQQRMKGMRHVNQGGCGLYALCLYYMLRRMGYRDAALAVYYNPDIEHWDHMRCYWNGIYFDARGNRKTARPALSDWGQRLPLVQNPLEECAEDEPDAPVTWKRLLHSLRATPWVWNDAFPRDRYETRMLSQARRLSR